MIGYDTILGFKGIWCIFYERDTEGTYKFYSDASWTNGIRWRVAPPIFSGENTQPQHPHLKHSLRFFNPNPHQCTVWRCVHNCVGCKH